MPPARCCIMMMPVPEELKEIAFGIFLGNRVYISISLLMPAEAPRVSSGQRMAMLFSILRLRELFGFDDCQRIGCIAFTGNEQTTAAYCKLAVVHFTQCNAHYVICLCMVNSTINIKATT